ncbi:ABC transporter related protein [Ruminiclostridium papyrosolvens DSM 2782]|uniref:ABC transporter related protein n=1 Tax=Ruminiclostridium papyrosolvens DSM 2782 TaxID=588581 RepID=F1TF09_9FIRM|nr:ABC transporter ATP-binding protein [Ruminiclostridium papyrosolvens]EGD46947.1 ABC transporter related protein [Ruminiclostridium papyrosolvens DSM 2782]WES33805.1 ABC transporter ATP-binding protein [Ruminiclostridium papyrosolvens DSM 2782]
MEILKTKDLCKSYGIGEIKVEALKNINISVQQGEFVAIVGASGSGKSTLLHLLGGIDKPTGGNVIVDEADIYTLSEKKLAVFRRRKIGFIFQSYNLIPVLTAEENMTMPLLLDNREVDRKYFEELLAILGLQNRRNHLPSELSGGQQQRVSIGRAMVYKPSIILADEPTGNLDSKNSKEIIELLQYSVKKYHQTLIVITHDLAIASAADRVITIDDGCVVKNEVIKG